MLISDYTTGHHEANRYGVRIYLCLIMILVAACIASSALHAQADSSQHILFAKIHSAAEEEYGIHHELVNGALFEDKYQDVIGHPYYLNYFSDKGSLVYRGKQYSDLSLRYNIYDQQVLLTYPYDNQIFRLHLHNEFLSEFTIENKKFMNAALGTDAEARIYQVIGEDLPVRIIYSHTKSPAQVYSSTSDKRKFEQQRETFILENNNLVSYNGNGSFARKFASHNKSGIKKYLRQNKIKVQYAGDDEMERLIEYINTLDQDEKL